MTMYEVKEWINRYRLGGYYDAEILSILQVQFDLDEFQTEDLYIILERTA